jgi:hypothetical protein
MFMSFGKWFGVVLLGLGCSIAAHAQLGVYGIYSATGFSGIQCYDPTGQCSSANGHVNPSGGWGGVFYDFRNFGPVRLGADVRAGALHSNKSAVTSAGGGDITTSHSVLGGVRGTVRTPFNWLRPYGQFSLGWTRSDVSDPTLTQVNGEYEHTFNNFLQYEVFAGADIRLLPYVDLRAVELGIGNMNRVGNGTGTSSVGVKSIGAGIVVRFPFPSS